MEAPKKHRSLLFVTNVIEPKDEIDENFEKCFNLYTNLTRNTSEQNISQGRQQHDDIQLAHLYLILTDQKQAAKMFRNMTMLFRDGLAVCGSVIIQIILEKWLKLTDACRAQLLWVAREMVRASVQSAENICHSLIRQIAGGDISSKNIWLTEAVVDIFIENRKWLDGIPSLIPMVVYTFLRTIVDHNPEQLHSLRQKETELCVGLLREKWSECAVIGRDLVRLLQYVARLPEFESLWSDIMLRPSSLSPEFTGVAQLMRCRTSRKFLISRLTLDMEKKVHYITTQVKFGQQKRYQDWLQKQYLNTPESQSLRCDLIRYICAVVHPTNEQLCSEIIPRWAVIGWLLTTCTRESIMNIEPCILVMHHSLRPHPAITATLLDFMCRILSHFCPPLREEVRNGIFSSLKTLLERRVLPSFIPLFDNNKLDKELRKLVRQTFPEFMSEAKEDVSPMGALASVTSDVTPSASQLERSLSNSSVASDSAEFSDEDDEEDKRAMKSDVTSTLLKLAPAETQLNVPKLSNDDLKAFVDKLEGDVRLGVEELIVERSNEAKCDVMDRLIQAIVADDDFDQDSATLVANCLCQISLQHFVSSPFPQKADEDSLEESVSACIYVIFRNLCATPEENPSRQPILLLLEEMYNMQPRLGYHFLYFLKVGKVHDEKMTSYRELCKSMDQRDLSSCLRNDLRVCQEDDVRLFIYLVPDVFREFASATVGKPDILHLVVSCIDGSQLQDLVCEILQGHLVLLKKDHCLSVFNASLEWETIEQYFLWQLILAHELPIETVMPVLPKLDYAAHAEILTNIVLSLKQDAPTLELLRPILCRITKPTDLFAVSILKYWATEYEDKLVDQLHTLLTKPPDSNAPRKRSKLNRLKACDGPSVEQILNHLDQIRVTCRNISFLSNETIQQALQTACSDQQKIRYSDLLAFAEPEEYSGPGSRRVLRQVASRRASQAASNAGNQSPKGGRQKKARMSSGSESDSSDEEESKVPKKRRRRTDRGDEDSD